MGIVIPQVVTEDRASGAQVIDGSLKFVGSRSNYLQRSQSGGNRRTFTWSGWIKPDGSYTGTSNNDWFTASEGNSTGGADYGFGVRFYEASHSSHFNQLMVYEYENTAFKLRYLSNRRFSDFSAFYHIVVAVDTTQTTDANKVRVYANGEEITSWKVESHPSTNLELTVNESGKNSQIGCAFENASTILQQCDGLATNFYLIDGQQLGPESFGYTDPLTNTWRPKKFSGTFPSGTAASSLFTSNTLLTWSSGESNWTLSNSNKTATYSGSSSYSEVWSGALDGSTTYAFRLTNTGVDGNGGWLFTDSTGVSGSHPDERGSNTLGQRANETTLGAHGSFATANSVSAGQGAMSGFGDSQPSDGSQIDFIINMSARKVWVKAASSGSWVGGGDPTNSSSTASFELPSGTIYFGSVQYSSCTVEFGDDSTGNNSFYLPMDGNSPIGEDQSGRGNNWTPVKFGGSVALDNPQVSGARPILNTLPGGTIATPGVFGSKVNKTFAVTVASVGGSNKYHFDGVDRPNPTLIRGATYTFDQSDSTNGGGGTHPLRFATAADAAGSTQYTNGVITRGTPGQAGAYTKITVPHNAPDTLYYYCTNHGGMGSSTSQITDETKADLYAWKCVAAVPLFHNKDYSSEINCTTTAKTVASYEGTQAYSGQSNFYNRSLDLGATSARNATSLAASADFELSPGNTSNPWTVEIWGYRLTNTPNAAYLPLWEINGDSGLGVGWLAFLGSDGSTNYFYYGHGGASHSSLTWATSPINKWVHNAFVSDGTNLMVFEDGVCMVRTAISALGGPPAYFGRNAQINFGTQNYSGDSGNRNFGGSLQDFRVYKGIAKYTASAVGEQSYIPAATNPDILPDSPSGVSGSSKLTKITDGAVTFDGTSDELNVAGHSDLAFGTGNFTIECFTYFNSFDDTYPTVLSKLVDSTLSWIVRVKNDGKVVWYSKNGSGTNNESSTTPISLKKWQHIAVVREGTGSNQFKMYVDGKLVKTMTDDNDYNDSNNLCIGTQQAGGGNTLNGYISNVRLVKGTAVYTSEFTPPTEPLTAVTNTKLLCCQSNVTSGAAVVSPNISGSLNNGRVWSSLVSGPTRKEDRVANAFNGSTSGPGAIPAYPGTLTFAPGLTSISSVKIYGYYAGSGVTLHVNGSAQSPSSGAFTLTISTSTLDSVVWTATNGSNYMRIDAIEIDSTVLIDPVVGPDDSNEAATTFNPFNTDINTVRGQETGYATFNSINSKTYSAYYTLSNGNLKCTSVGGSSRSSGSRGYCASSIGMSSGKYYCEFTIDLADNDDHALGIVTDAATGIYTPSPENFVYRAGGGKITNSGAASYGATYTTGDTISVAFNADNGELTCFNNGISQGILDTVTMTGKTYYFIWAMDAGSAQDYQVTVNFGQKPFKFPPPDGFQSLNAASVRPETVITRPDQFVSATLYTGNQSVRTISTGNTPDLVWIKDRTDTNGHNHNLIDTVRGAPKILQSDKTDTEVTNSTDGLTAFTSNGFTLGANTLGTQSYEMNKTGNGYVAWCWKAGGKDGSNVFNVDGVGYASAAAAGLTGGSRTITGASVGTKQGFSIIQYTGNATTPETIAHGLLKAPQFIIGKNTGQDIAWSVYTTAVTGANSLQLNSDGGPTGGTGIWGNTEPTSSVFTVGNDGNMNGDGQTMIAYCWHDIPGLQKFGSYTGSNSSTSAEGPFIELGFRPALVMIKRSNGTGNWIVYDNKRDTFNPTNKRLYWNTNGVEATQSGYDIDFLSNGFKITGGNNDNYNAASTYVYAAWAEEPVSGLYGSQSNAR